MREMPHGKNTKKYVYIHRKKEVLIFLAHILKIKRRNNIDILSTQSNQ